MYNKYIQTYLNIILQSRKDNYYQQLLRTKDNYNQTLYTQEQAKNLSEILFSYNNPKKEKMTLWFLIKGTVRLPQDQYKIDQAFNLVEKQNLNFQEFSTPQEIINRTDKSTLRINAQDQDFNPDTQPTFSNKQILKNGIIIYNIDNDKQGQLAVRKAIDVNWGYDANPWCLAARKDGFIQANEQQIQRMSQQQKQQIGLYDEDCLSVAWNFWSKTYTAYPKRIAFKNGQLLAFCANDRKEIKWWDRNDKYSSNIPVLQNEDDPEWFNYQYNIVGIAKDPNTPPEILSQLANNKDTKLYVAGNSNTPVEILDKLVDDNDVFLIKDTIALNPNASSKILQKLSNDEDQYIRQLVAAHPNTQLKTLIKLANDKSQNVKRGVARNPNTPLEFLTKLSNEDDFYVLSNIAINPNTPPALLAKLSNDKDYSIRRDIAKNPNTPLEILNKLTNDEKWSVRYHIAYNPNVSLEILNKLANDEDYNVRYYVAKSPNTPLEILQKLSNDNQNDVKCGVADNPNTPLKILQKLINEEDYQIRYNIARNPNASLEILNKLKHDKNKYVKTAALNALNALKHK